MSSEREHDDQIQERVETRPAPAPARPSQVSQMQRRLGNSGLLQLRAQQLRAAQLRPVQLDLADDVRADHEARMVERRAAAAEQALVDKADQVKIPSGGEPLPAPLQHVAEQKFGVSMGDVQVLRGADSATDPLNAKAFATEQGGTPKVVMSSMDMTTPDAQFTLMHELSHVAQQKRGMTSGLDGLGGDDHLRDHLEEHADSQATELLADLNG